MLKQKKKLSKFKNIFWSIWDIFIGLKKMDAFINLLFKRDVSIIKILTIFKFIIDVFIIEMRNLNSYICWQKLYIVTTYIFKLNTTS